MMRTKRLHARLAYVLRVDDHASVAYAAASARRRTPGPPATIASNPKVKSSQVNTLPKAKSETRSKQNKDMHKCRSVYSERGVRVPLPVLTSGGE